MKIITISRQFGSGGRELGEKIASLTGWDYYDRNIIEQLSRTEEMDPDYIRRVFQDKEWAQSRMHGESGSFSQLDINSGWQVSLLSRQKQIISDIAALGKDCVIVGRDADILLREYRPFRVYVCADISFRLERCMRYESKKDGGRLSEKQILRNIRKIDRMRKETREILTGKPIGDFSSFDLIVNSTSWDPELLAEQIVGFSEAWFGQ